MPSRLQRKGGSASALRARRFTLATGVITGGAMGNGSTRWLSYDDMNAALGITSEGAKRIAMRHKWPRRPGNDGRALVAVPEERLQEAGQAVIGDDIGDSTDGDTRVSAGDITDDARNDARALIGYLERLVEKIGDVLADARNEVRASRFEADQLRAQAG